MHRRCDDRCLNASPHSPCSCACGGKNHAQGGIWPADDPRRRTIHYTSGARLKQDEENDQQLALAI